MLIVYFGADAGCGCSMLAHGTANCIAEDNKEKKVLLLFLSGYPGGEYTDTEFSHGIDELHIKLKSEVLTAQELESMCNRKKNLFMLSGSKNLKERKEYMPEEIQQLISIGKESFDYIIADAGCSLDLGMGIGALKSGGKNILVTTQSPRILKRYLQKESLFSILEVTFETLIINRFLSKHFLPSARRLREDFKIEDACIIEYSDCRLQAEIDRVGIAQLDKEYKQQLEEMVCHILKKEDTKQKSTRKGLFTVFKGGIHAGI